jgi:hypothetical protein
MGTELAEILSKFRVFLINLNAVWSTLQDIISVKGGLYVDVFGVVMIIRLLAPLKGYQPITPSEAAVWASTIGAFAAAVIGGPKQS